MKARKIPAVEGRPEITAQPKSMLEEVATTAPSEEGLSVDPEEMGKSFIRYATEQGNFESSSQRELAIGGEAASDAALQGAHFSEEGTIWDSTVDLTMENDGVDGATLAASPRNPDDDEDERADEIERGVAEIDLTESAIDEGSLLDDEADVLGEVIEPMPETDDTASHAKRRGRPVPRKG